MKKIVRYMQDQALQYSQERFTSHANLAPHGNIEPQQRKRKAGNHTNATTNGAGAGTSAAGTVRDNDNYNMLTSAMEKVQYGSDNLWQNYEVYLTSDRSSSSLANSNNHYNHSDHHHQEEEEEEARPDPSTANQIKPKYWVVFIHGGYFRDPEVTSASFYPALSHLINADAESATIRQIQSHVEGYASINYRLAPNEKYLQDDSVPAYERRDAQWPQMMDDVLAALRHLQQNYGFGQNYLLVGHSVGATMAMLAALKAHDYENTTTASSSSNSNNSSSGGGGGGRGVEAPLAVVPVCGIYDFETLHRTFPSYVSLTRNAIKDETDWVKASPARYNKEGYDKLWARGSRRWVLLAQSKNDGLVDFAQAEQMYKVFEDDGLILSDLIEIEGQHNEVWGKGHELARVVAMGVGEMISLNQ